MNKKMSDLFANCAWNVPYEEVGHDVNYAFVEEESTLYIYFAGSKDVKQKGAFWDWFRNFWFFPKYIRPYEDMKIPYKVHSGFLAAWDEVKHIVKDKILEKDGDDFKWKEIVIVGYSHGGALSGLCHEFCQFWRHDLHEENKITGFGFESPRFLHCWKVPKKLKDRWRNYTVIRNCKDIVTHCPPWIFKFCHVGVMFKMQLDSKGLINDHMPDNVYNNLKIAEKAKK